LKQSLEVQIQLLVHLFDTRLHHWRNRDEGCERKNKHVESAAAAVTYIHQHTTTVTHIRHAPCRPNDRYAESIHLPGCLCVMATFSWPEESTAPQSTLVLFLPCKTGYSFVCLCRPTLALKLVSQRKTWKFAVWPLRCRGGSTLGQRGHTPPDSLVAPDSKTSWPFWRDFWGPKMLQNPNLSGLCSGPARRYSAPQTP